MTDKAPLQFWCKASGGQNVERGAALVRIISKRALFQIFGDGVTCGQLTLPYRDIERAVVYRSRRWFMPVTTLYLYTADNRYRFVFNPWIEPDEYLDLEVEVATKPDF
jgi:hypothetical protein